MSKKLQSFFTTENFESAWKCYQDWCIFQEQIGCTHQVEFGGCRVNGKNCWEVRLSQSLHDKRAGVDSVLFVGSTVSKEDNKHLETYYSQSALSILQGMQFACRFFVKGNMWTIPLMVFVSLEPCETLEERMVQRAQTPVAMSSSKGKYVASACATLRHKV